ncbi:hypothetical protein [Haloferula sp. A504]|uniref:hypothetical protein n=1 Tax=Haloferula sp. A504 TaxID=3373601 RepID=UPI0031CA21A3|nr:hypothetical protein [Verrucomicrobiaceae bacterium E54]
MRRVFACLCLLSTAILPLAAQDDRGGEGRRKPGRSAWFACTSLPKDFENPTKILAGETITELEIPRYMASDPVKIPKDGMLRLVAEDPDPSDPEKAQFRILAEAQVPEGVREALIILVPLPEPKDDLIFTAKVQNLAKFKGGDRLYINLSREHVRVRLGKDTVNLPPKHADIYKAPALTKPTNIAVLYEFYHAARKEWKIISGSTVVLRPTRRNIFVFNGGSRPGQIKKHKILFPLPIETPE